MFLDPIFFYPTTLYPREKTIWTTLGSNPARQLGKRARYPLRHRLSGRKHNIRWGHLYWMIKIFLSIENHSWLSLETSNALYWWSPIEWNTFVEFIPWWELFFHSKKQFQCHGPITRCFKCTFEFCCTMSLDFTKLTISRRQLWEICVLGLLKLHKPSIE